MPLPALGRLTMLLSLQFATLTLLGCGKSDPSSPHSADTTTINSEQQGNAVTETKTKNESPIPKKSSSTGPPKERFANSPEQKGDRKPDPKSNSASTPSRVQAYDRAQMEEYHLLARFLSNPARRGEVWMPPLMSRGYTSDYFEPFGKLLISPRGAVQSLACEHLDSVVKQYQLMPQLNQRLPTAQEFESLFGKTLLQNLGRRPEEMELGEFLRKTFQWSMAAQARDQLERDVAMRHEKTWEKLAKLAPPSGGTISDKASLQVTTRYIVDKNSTGVMQSSFSCGLVAVNVSGRELHHCSLFTTLAVLNTLAGDDFPISLFHYLVTWKPGEEINLYSGPFYDTAQLQNVYQTRYRLYCDESTEDITRPIPEAIERLVQKQLDYARPSFEMNNFSGGATPMKYVDRIAKLYPPAQKMRDEFVAKYQAEHDRVLEGTRLLRRLTAPGESLDVIVDGKPWPAGTGFTFGKPDPSDVKTIPFVLKSPPLKEGGKLGETRGSARIAMSQQPGQKKPFLVLSLVITTTSNQETYFYVDDKISLSDSRGRKFELKPRSAAKNE